MAPFESRAYFDGAARARDVEMQSRAALTSYLMNMWVAKGKRVRPADIYRSRFDDRPEGFASKEDFRSYMREREEEANGG